MGGSFMLRKWKKVICYIFVLTALPYLITIFINGPMRLSAPTQKQQEVAVMSEGDSKAKLLSLDEYGYRGGKSSGNTCTDRYL